MHPLISCLIYVAVIGIISQLIGPFLPRRWFHANRFPYKAWAWEKGGRIYNKLGIRRWKDHVPDMSRIFKNMVAKKLPLDSDSAKMERLVQETCVAELVHAILIVLGLWCLRLWPGIGGVVFWLVYAVLGNLSFLIIQRYNRPRLVRLAAKAKSRETAQGASSAR